MGRDVITCHVLDTVVGKPASGITCTLTKLNGLRAENVSTATTDDDGRIINWDSPLDAIKTADGKVAPGTYKIKFDTGLYLSKATDGQAFFPFIEVVFNIQNPDSHYHIPLLLSNFSYSTYRGS